jgi:hypothetical protein
MPFCECRPFWRARLVPGWLAGFGPSLSQASIGSARIHSLLDPDVLTCVRLLRVRASKRRPRRQIFGAAKVSPGSRFLSRLLCQWPIAFARRWPTELPSAMQSRGSHLADGFLSGRRSSGREGTAASLDAIVLVPTNERCSVRAIPASERELEVWRGTDWPRPRLGVLDGIRGPRQAASQRAKPRSPAAATSLRSASLTSRCPALHSRKQRPQCSITGLCLGQTLRSRTCPHGRRVFCHSKVMGPATNPGVRTSQGSLTLIGSLPVPQSEALGA